MSDGRAAWYHHFWPWFIVALLSISVGASLVTVAIAFRHADVEISRTPVDGALPDTAPSVRPAGAVPGSLARPPGRADSERPESVRPDSRRETR